MAVTTTTFAYALKRLYPQSEIDNLVYKDNPLLAMIGKQGGFMGSSTQIAIRYADNIAESATFSTAQAQAATSASKGVQMTLTRQKAYALWQIDTESILAAESDKAAFLRTLKTEVDSALNNFGRARGIDLYRDGAGERGQVGSVSGAGPFVFTLANVNDITNFEVGRLVTFSNGSTKLNALRSATGIAVTAVDRDAGTFTTATNPNSAVANDWVFFEGDRAAGAITAATFLRIAGLEAWNPVTAPTAGDSFFGVDRSVDASRLAGIRIDISGLNPEEGLVTAMHRVAREGARPSHLFMNNIDSKNVQVALGAKAELEYTRIGEIGFSGIRVNGPKGDVMIYADQNAPSGVGRLLDLSTWKLRYMRELAFVYDLDGSNISRLPTADAWEGRVAFFGNLQCTAPGYNARLVLPT